MRPTAGDALRRPYPPINRFRAVGGGWGQRRATHRVAPYPPINRFRAVGGGWGQRRATHASPYAPGCPACRGFLTPTRTPDPCRQVLANEGACGGVLPQALRLHLLPCSFPRPSPRSAPAGAPGAAAAAAASPVVAVAAAAAAAVGAAAAVAAAVVAAASSAVP